VSLVLVNVIKEIGSIQPAAMYERDAAKYLKLSVNDLRKFVEDGRIIARKHPGRSRRLYLKMDLDDYLRSLEQEKRGAA
jgi:excisionase family DNA binding protein